MTTFVVDLVEEKQNLGELQAILLAPVVFIILHEQFVEKERLVRSTPPVYLSFKVPVEFMQFTEFQRLIDLYTMLYSLVGLTLSCRLAKPT